MQPYTRDTWPSNPVGTAVIGLPTLEPSFSVQQVLPWVLSTLNTNTSAAGIQFGTRNADGSQNEKLGFLGETSNKTSVRFAGRGNRLRNYVDARKLIAGCACQLGSYQGF